MAPRLRCDGGITAELSSVHVFAPCNDVIFVYNIIVSELVVRTGHLWHLSVYYRMSQLILIRIVHSCNPEAGPSPIESQVALVGLCT